MAELKIKPGLKIYNIEAIRANFTFIFSFLMLGNDIPILNSVFNLFYNHVPLFAEAFRFTFTKFSILYAFSFSIFLTVGLSVILEFLSKFKYEKIILPLGFIAILFYYCLLLFKANLSITT